MVTPTRSSASRRKRNSTTQALNLLNNVMNRKDSLAEERQTQSAQPARQLRNIPRAPRRDLFEIPNSPEYPQSKSSPLAAPAPLTPRRSTRLSRPRKLRTPARTERSRVDYHKDNVIGEESEQLPHDESDNKPVNEGTDPNGLEDEDNELIGNFDLFSEANSSRRSRSASPSAFLTQELEQSGRFESSQSPSKIETLKRGPEFIASNRRITRNASKAYRPTSEAVLSGPSVVVHNSPSNVPDTPLSKEQPRRSHETSSSAKDDDGDVEMDGGEQMMNPEHADGDDESADEASSSSFSSLFVRQDSPDQIYPTATRSGKLRQLPDTRARQARSSGTPSAVHHQSTFAKSPGASGRRRRQNHSQGALDAAQHSVGQQLNRPRTSSSTLPVNEANHPGPNGPLASRRIRNRNSRIITNYNNHETAENPVQESKYPRCKEAMKFGQQEHNWKVLIDEALKMKQKANSATKYGFKDAIEFIDDLQRWYENLYQNSERPPRLSSRDSYKHEEYLDQISYEGDSVLDEVYNLVMKRQERQGRKLFETFEARVIPAIIELIFAVFDAYHSSPRSLSSIYDHLHSALSKLAHLCNRMTSLAKERYVSSTCTQKLREPLQKLIEASEARSLESTQLDASDSSSEGSGSMDVNENTPIVTTQKPWTDAEGLALLDGLLRHKGPRRYISIMKDFGHRLEGRTIRQLRDKAEEVHDNYIPQIHDELRTREGQEKWHWLLSVRE